MQTRVEVQPEILRWAVERSGRPLEDFAPGVGDWLQGQKRPTFKQLQDFAKKAMVPFGYLFLKEPPEEPLPLPDFRTRKDSGVRSVSPNLLDTIYEMQRRQEWMREYLVEEGHEELPFVGSAKVGDDVVQLAKRMRETLGLGEGWADQVATWEAALRALRLRVEEAGVLIFTNGIVANNTSRKLDPDEFQGFVFVDRIAPLIFVNGADFKGAQMFTIAHELAHVWIGQSALFELPATQAVDGESEEFCNRVAAEFLAPTDAIKSAWKQTSADSSAFVTLARQFKVSPIVIARRAKDLHFISAKDFFAFYANYMGSERAKKAKQSGGDFYSNQNVRLGGRFGPAVVAAVQEGRLAYTEGYDLTQLRGATFEKYAERLGRSERQ